MNAKTDTPLHLVEFPDFGVMPIRIPSAWAETSWHNNVCPSFELETPDGFLTVWVDYEDPAQRELPDEPRYRAARTDKDGQSVGEGYAFSTDEEHSIEVFMSLAALREEVRDWQEALSGEREGLDSLCEHCDAIFMGPLMKVEDGALADGYDSLEKSDLFRALDEARQRTGCPYITLKQGVAPDTFNVVMMLASPSGTVMRGKTGDLTEDAALFLLRGATRATCVTELRAIAASEQHDSAVCALYTRAADNVKTGAHG